MQKINSIKLIKEYFYNKFHQNIFWKLLKLIKSDIQLIFHLFKMAKPNLDKTKIKIICINHFFDGEIDALKQNSSNKLSIEILKPQPFFTRAYIWYPDSVKNAQVTIDKWPEDINKKYHTYCTFLFYLINFFYKFEVLITPSDSFFWLRDFIKIANKNGVLTIVADKEGMISPGNYVTGPDRIKNYYPPVAEFFFVWSERQKKYWINSGVPKKNVFVIGSLRTDLITKKSQNLTRNSVIFFDFDFDAYLVDLDWSQIKWNKKKNWNQLRKSCHEVIYKLAKAYPHINFYIKTHPQQVASFFYSNFNKLNNVVVLTGSAKDLPKYFSSSLLVIGFQTTAILEAALSGVPVIYAAWGPLFNVTKDMLLPWHKGNLGISFAKSKNKLEQMAIKIIDKPRKYYIYSGSIAEMNKYFYMANGYTSYRFTKKLENLVR